MFKFLLKRHIGEIVLFTTKYKNEFQSGTISYQNHIVISTETTIYNIKDVKHIKLL